MQQRRKSSREFKEQAVELANQLGVTNGAPNTSHELVQFLEQDALRDQSSVYQSCPPTARDEGGFVVMTLNGFGRYTILFQVLTVRNGTGEDDLVLLSAQVNLA